MSNWRQVWLSEDEKGEPDDVSIGLEEMDEEWSPIERLVRVDLVNGHIKWDIGWVITNYYNMIGSIESSRSETTKKNEIDQIWSKLFNDEN